MKIIRITTNNEISSLEYPVGSISEENYKLCELIGNGCDLYEHVMPRRLYRDFGAIAEVTDIPGEAVALLIDEEGRLKTNSINTVASILYETDHHGNPIMGDVLIVGKKWCDSGISFCGINDLQFRTLYPKLEKLVIRAKITEGLA